MGGSGRLGARLGPAPAPRSARLNGVAFSVWVYLYLAVWPGVDLTPHNVRWGLNRVHDRDLPGALNERETPAASTPMRNMDSSRCGDRLTDHGGDRLGALVPNGPLDLVGTVQVARVAWLRRRPSILVGTLDSDRATKERPVVDAIVGAAATQAQARMGRCVVGASPADVRLAFSLAADAGTSGPCQPLRRPTHKRTLESPCPVPASRSGRPDEW
jgi:hypothetical protein